MTDSISMTLDISPLPYCERQKVPCSKVFRGDPRHPKPTRVFDAKQAWTVPLTGNPLLIKAITDSYGTPVALSAEFNLPNATVGQNAELGHSVRGASTVALELFKVYLAEQGVSLDSLAKLTRADIGLGTTTLTYLIPVADARSTQRYIELIELRFSQFFPLTKDRMGGSGVGSKGSRTAYLHMPGWSIRVYSTPPSKIPGDDPAVHAERIEFAKHTIRIELTLTRATLTKEGLANLAAWDRAHELGTYAMLFDKFVRRKGLRLHERLRQDKPDEYDMWKVSGVNRFVVEEYLAGKSMELPGVWLRASDLATRKMRSASRLEILKKMRIDIDIEWVVHCKLGSVALNKVIKFSGDCNPPPGRVADSFCRDNLHEILRRLKEALYLAALRHLSGPEWARLSARDAEL